MPKFIQLAVAAAGDPDYIPIFARQTVLEIVGKKKVFLCQAEELFELGNVGGIYNFYPILDGTAAVRILRNVVKITEKPGKSDPASDQICKKIVSFRSISQKTP